MSKLLDRARYLSWVIATRDHHDFYSARSQANLLLQGSRATKDPQVVEHLQQIFSKDLLTAGLNRNSNLREFVDNMRPWLEAHTTNQLFGLDQYQADFSAGTTQAFDSFYYRHRDRRLRCFVGEYFYHLKTWISTGTNWSFISDDDPLANGDALVISIPFCDTGNEYPDTDAVLARCDQLGIPVLVDCCYYTISGGVKVDLTCPAIDTVAFSLSKAFPVAHLRIGVRYTRPGLFDGQKLHDSINYNNTVSACIGLNLIDRFGSDYIHRAYQTRQQEVCDYFELTSSKTVLFAVGNSDWDRYNRNNLLKSYSLDLDPTLFQNRISLVGIFDNWDLYKTIKNEYKITF